MLLLAACRMANVSPDVEPSAIEDDATDDEGSFRPRLERDPDAGVALVYQGRGVDGLAIPGRVVVLENDFLHLHGVEPGSGAIVWRRRLQTEAAGTHGLVADGDRVLVHGGSRLIVVDARDGRVLGRNDDVPPHGRHQMSAHDGACAVVGPCSLAVVDCIDGAQLGTALGSSADTCRYAPSVIGRSADITIVAAPKGDGAVLTAIPKEGTPRWAQAVTAAPGFHGGVADGLDAAWVVDDARVLVRRASTGEERWRAPLGFLVDRVELRGGLLIVVGHSGRRGTVVAFELDTGRERWRRKLGGRRVPLLAGADPAPVATGGWRTYELLDPETGATTGRIAAARDETLWADVDGAYVRTGGEVDELGPDGTLARLQPFTGGDVLAIGATHLVARAGRDLLFYDRLVLRERARLGRDFELEPTSGALGPHRVLLRRADASGVLFVVVGLEPVSRRGRPAPHQSATRPTDP